MSRGHEIELKLEVDEGGGGLLRDHPLLSGQQATPARQVSTYFDTDEGTLRKAGFSLRVRQAGDRYVQTIKQNGQTSAGLFDRPEWEQRVDGCEVDFAAAEETPLGDILTGKVRKRLAPVIRSDVRRTVWNIMKGGSQVELILDEGTITGGSNSERVNEIELELKTGDAASLLDVARELAGQIPLRLGVLSKAERGYALADGASGKVAKAERIALHEEMTAAEGFAAIASACLRHFRLNEPLVAARQDPAALHQARVAMRRLRSGFTLFRPVIADAEYERLREEVRWFTDQLGDARNLDVLLKRLPARAKRGSPGAALRQRLEGARSEAYARVLQTLDSKRLRRLMLDLVAWIETGAWRSENPAAAQSLPEFAVRRLDKRWRQVKQAGRRLAELDAEPRHRLRIEVKKLRYAVEFLSSLQTADEAADQKAFLAALEEMQERLGELNDVETAHELLARLVGRGKTAEAMLRHADRALASNDTEAEQVGAAEKAYRQLRAIGPFWR
ncbi:MAG TPA: CHAD domain-containing protein [Allosphingosinicella sp.]